MAKGAADHRRHPSSSPLPLFIDTNLDTHLAVLASPDETVADLKGRIMTEHVLCFPNFGQVAVRAVKVKRRVSFYHLSDSMAVKFAFSGIKGSWFLHLDLEPMTSAMKSQMETARVIMGENNGQPEEQNVLQTNHNSSLLLITGEDRNQGSVANGMSVEEGHIQTSAPSVHSSETLTDTTFQKPSAHGDSLLPNVSSPQKQSLHVSSNELYRRTDPCAPETELVTESDAVVGSNHQKISGQVADHGVEADADVPIIDSKKGNTRKRSSALQNDQLLDGKSEHPYVEKKKRKKEKEREKVQPFNTGVEDHSSGHNLEGGLCSEEISQLEKVLPENSQEKLETSMMPLEGSPSKPSRVEFSLQQTPIDGRQKKKKKKHLSTNDEPPQDEAVDKSLSNSYAILGKQAAVENHVEQLVKDNNDLGKESGAADLIEESAQKELDGGSTEVGMADPLSTNLKLSNYTTERLSKSTETSTDIPIQEVSTVDSDGPLLLNVLAHEKESSATDICKEAEQPSILAEVVPEVPAILPHTWKRSKGEKDVSSKHDVVESSVKAVDKENVDETSGNNNDELSKVSDVALNDADMSNKIAMESGIPSEITVKCSQHTRKKKSKKSVLHFAQSNTHETANSSIDQVPGENQNKVSSTSKELPSKKLTGAAVSEDAAAAGNSAVVESTFPSNPSDKKKKRRQKKLEKIEPHHEESNVQSSTHETVNTSRDQVIEEFLNETSVRDLEHPGNESKQAAVLGEAVGNSTTIPSNPNEKKSKRSRKKSEKIELISGESIRAESIHSFTDKATEGNPRESLEDHQNETSGSHLRHVGKGSEEATVLSNPSTVDLLVPLSPSDKKSKRVKKSGKTELPKKESSVDEAVHPLVKVTTKENLGETFDGITTEGNPRESLEDYQNETSGSHLRHVGKGSEEATVLSNPSTVDLLVPLSPSDKKSKRVKKSGKTELPKKESSMDEAVHPLVKVTTKENRGETFDGITTGVGENSKSLTTVREAAGVENTTESDFVITKNDDGGNSCHKGKKNDGPPVIDHLSSSYGLDHSFASDPTQENLEKVSGTTSKCSRNKFNARVSSDETDQNMDRMNPSNLDSTGLNDSSDMNETGHLSAENATEEITAGLQKAYEKLDMENVQDTVDNGSAEFVETKDHGELPKSDGGKLDFFKFFDPQANKLKPSPELPSLETETKKTSKEKTKRKKKLNPSPQDSINLPKPPVSDKQHTILKKPQDSDSGKHSLSDPAEHIAKEELFSSKKHKKKDANRTHKSDVNVPDSSYNIGSPRRSNDAVNPGKKRQNYESQTHFQTSLSSVDDGSKHPNGKNSMRTGSKLQSLRHNEGEDMDDLVASSDSTQEDTPVIQKRYRVAVRKVPKNRSAKVPQKFNEEKMTLAPLATIFSDAASGSSDDEFEIRNSKAPEKSTSDNSSAHADSDEGIEETQTSYKNSPGSESMDNRKVEEKNNGAGSGLKKTPNVKRKGKPLGMLLKSTSSYKKAKLSASQSEMEDSESQQIDVVLETQPELGLL